MSIAHFASVVNALAVAPVGNLENWDPALEDDNSSSTPATVVYSNDNRVVTVNNYGDSTRISVASGITRFTGTRYIEFKLLTGQATVPTIDIIAQLLDSSRSPTINNVGDIVGTRIAGVRINSNDGIGNGERVQAWLNGQQLDNTNTSIEFFDTGDVLGLIIDFDTLSFSAYLNDVLIGTYDDFGIGDQYGTLRPSFQMSTTTLWSVQLNQRDSEFDFEIPQPGAIAWADDELVCQGQSSVLNAIANPETTNFGQGGGGTNPPEIRLCAGQFAAWQFDQAAIDVGASFSMELNTGVDIDFEIWRDTGGGPTLFSDEGVQTAPFVPPSLDTSGQSGSQFYLVVQNTRATAQPVRVNDDAP